MARRAIVPHYMLSTEARRCGVAYANVPALAYVYGAEAQADADIANTLTRDEAQRCPQHRQANP